MYVPLIALQLLLPFLESSLILLNILQSLSKSQRIASFSMKPTVQELLQLISSILELLKQLLILLSMSSLPVIMIELIPAWK
jgi:hypothetical protein